MKRFQPVNYNEDKDSFFVYVAPKPQETENQMVLYTSVNTDYKLAQGSWVSITAQASEKACILCKA